VERPALGTGSTRPRPLTVTIVRVLNSSVALPILSVDWADPLLFADGPPYPRWAAQRAAAPVWFSRSPALGAGFWSVCDHRGVRELLDRPREFSAAHGTRLADPVRRPVRPRRHADEACHPWLVMATGRYLDSDRLRSLAGTLAAALRAQLRRYLDGEVCDFARDLAGQLPQEALRQVFGLPAREGAALSMWGTSFLVGDDEDGPLDYGVPTSAGSAAALAALFRRELRRRGPAPGDDLLTLLAPGADRMPVGEIVTYCVDVLISAYAAARMAVAGAIALLADRPGLLSLLRAEPHLVDGAVEELLRLASPVTHVRRTATYRTRLAGVRIAAGETVVAWLPAANRDPAMFADPDRFDPCRPAGPAVPFGVGPVEAVAGTLARLAVRVLVEELGERVQRVQSVRPPRWLRSVAFSGPTHHQVRFHPLIR
jgi:hydroxylation protein CepL